jgi:hypothetical protein
MLGYHYKFLSDDGQTAAIFILYSASDAAACELAGELLAKSHWPAVEVWQKDAMILRTSHTDARERLSA